MILWLWLVLLEDAGASAGAVTAPGCETENAVCQAYIDVNEALPYWNGKSCVSCSAGTANAKPFLDVSDFFRRCVASCGERFVDDSDGPKCVDTCEEYVVKQDSKRICVSNCSLYGMKHYTLKYDSKVTPGKAKICTRECPSLHTEAEECVEECAPG